MADEDFGWVSSMIIDSNELLQLAMVSKKRSLSDLQDNYLGASGPFDESSYRLKVLLLSPEQSENDYDMKLTNEARGLGILPKDAGKTPDSIDSLAASLSLTAVSSDQKNVSSTHSRISQSTVPTSCGSSEQQRPATNASHTSYLSDHLPSPATTPSILSTSSKKPRFDLKGGLKRLSTMKHRKSDGELMVEMTSLEVNKSTDTGLSALSRGKTRSRASLASSFRSSSSSKVKIVPSYDEEAIQRSLDHERLKEMRKEQVAAANRFSIFEGRAYSIQRERHQSEMEALAKERKSLVEQKHAEHTKREEQLEERQLKAEEDFRNELDEQKRRAIIRLRHMEAYCNDGAPFSPTIEEGALPLQRPPRHVSDADYNKLSQQYRLVKSMDTLHESKINVLRGTQEQRAMQFLNKQEAELEKLLDEFKAEELDLKTRHQSEVTSLTNIFIGKKCRMVMRWKLAEEIERMSLEKDTHLKFGPLPTITFPELESAQHATKAEPDIAPDAELQAFTAVEAF